MSVVYMWLKTKYVTLETFLPADVWLCSEETKHT